jgi:hypothetical protein
VQLTIKNKGRLDIIYNKHGEIADVKSTGGLYVQYPISRTLQALVDLISIANVSQSDDDVYETEECFWEMESKLPHFSI